MSVQSHVVSALAGGLVAALAVQGFGSGTEPASPQGGEVGPSVEGSRDVVIPARRVREAPWTRGPWYESAWFANGVVLEERPTTEWVREEERTLLRLSSPGESGYRITLDLTAALGSSEGRVEASVLGFSDVEFASGATSAQALLRWGDVVVGTHEGEPSQVGFEVHGTFEGRAHCWHGFAPL